MPEPSTKTLSALQLWIDTGGMLCKGTIQVSSTPLSILHLCSTAGLLASSGSGALPRTGSWGATSPASSDSAALPRSSSPSLARSGSSSYLNPEPYEPPPLESFALARSELHSLHAGNLFLWF
jgi:hypothetical protein